MLVIVSMRNKAFNCRLNGSRVFPSNLNEIGDVVNLHLHVLACPLRRRHVHNAVDNDIGQAKRIEDATQSAIRADNGRLTTNVTGDVYVSLSRPRRFINDDGHTHHRRNEIRPHPGGRCFGSRPARRY